MRSVGSGGLGGDPAVASRGWSADQGDRQVDGDLEETPCARRCALKPRHLDLIKRTLTVEETVVEVSIKNSPTGARMLTKPYPKDNESRTMGLPPELVAQLAAHITERRLGPDDLLFATREGTPISRNTFRTRIWRPAVAKSGVDFAVRVHDLRHAHASWLLAGGSDLKAVMDRMGRPDHHHPEVPPPHARRRHQEPRRPQPHPPTRRSGGRQTRSSGAGPGRPARLRSASLLTDI